MSKIKRNGYPPIVLAMTPDGTWHGLYIDGELFAEDKVFRAGDIVKALGGEIRVFKLTDSLQFPGNVKDIYS